LALSSLEIVQDIHALALGLLVGENALGGLGMMAKEVVAPGSLELMTLALPIFVALV
jgi:hypothetical protein